MRECGGCTVCCYIGQIPEINKPVHTRCPHQLLNGCGIYGKRPLSCKVFKCAWLEGAGDQDGRPDKSGVLLLAKNTGQMKFIGICIETKPNAIKTTARDVVLDFARDSALPVFVVSYGKKPPDDGGDHVIILDRMHNRCGAIIKPETREPLSSDVSLYERRIET